jgi:predicted nucleic acid-binding protein
MTAGAPRTFPVRWVVDASVGIKLFVAEDLSDRAHVLFAQLTTDPPAQLHVPDLFYIECANILWKYVRRFGYPANQARHDVSDLGKLALRLTATVDLRSEALESAMNHGISAYDGCYVALAERLAVPLITADERLAQTFSGASTEVLRLADWSPPPLPSL